VKVLLAKFNLTNKVIAYVKDEGINLNSFIIALTSIMSCELLQLLQPFVGFYFNHVMFKACQYAMNETKVGACMKKVSLKDAQVTF